MSRRQADWVDELLKRAASQTPSDDFTFTDAANGLLDGFSFDSPYNEGVLDNARLPEVKGLSGLPDGVVTAEDETLQIGFEGDIELNDETDGMDLDAMLSVEEGGEDVPEAVRKAASIVNLDWLDPTQKQDPDRLPSELRPDRPPLNSIPALEAAWGSNEPTTGIMRVPAKDREAEVYLESIKEDQSSNLPGQAKTAEEKQDAILHASRQVHWGHDLKTILANLKIALGDTPLFRQAAEALRDDYGLAGKVFIRASAFPGLKNGKWVKELTKVARTAKYVITSDQAVADRLQMKMVASVPWGTALREFTPWMHATGYRLASGSPKEVLRRAFLNGPTVQEPAETIFPEHHPMMASDEEVRDEMARAAAVEPETPKTPEEEAIERKMKAAFARISRMVKENRLTSEEALRLRDFANRGASPLAITAAASELSAAAQRKSAAYDGPGKTALDARTVREETWRKLEASAVSSALWNRTNTMLKKAVQAGLLQESEASRILDLCRGKSAAYVEKFAAAAIRRAEEIRPERLEASDTAVYVGPHYVESAQAERVTKRMDADVQSKKIEEGRKKKALLHLAKLAKQTLITADDAREIAARCKTAQEIEDEAARIVATAGTSTYKGPVQKAAMMGRRFTATLDPTMERIMQVAKESGIKVVEFQSLLRWVRQQMSEGLAGRDLDTMLKARFAPPILEAASDLLKEVRSEHEGLSGHLYVDAAAYATASGIEGCEKGGLRHRANTLKHVLEMPRCASCTSNSAGTCLVYNKRLTSKPPVDDPKAYQRNAIRMADAPDAEVTASMFDPREFNLQSPMDNVTVTSEVSTEQLGEVLFGRGPEL